MAASVQYLNGGRALAFVLLGCGAFLAFRTLMGHSPLHNPPEALAVPRNQLSLGDIWETDAFPWTLTIQNPTAHLIPVQSLAVSCSCVNVPTRSFAIEPGNSLSVPIILNLAQAPRTAPDLNQSSDFRVSLFPMLLESLPVPRPWTVTAT